MSDKSIFFYPGIVVALGWTFLNILKIVAEVDSLHQENPTCTKTNPNKWAILIPTIIVMVVVKGPLEKFSTEVFQKIIPEKKFPLGSKERAEKAQMLGERIFKLVINVTCVALLYKILLQEDCNFLHIYLGGTFRDPLYYANYPCMLIPKNLDDFYIFKISYHIYELFYSVAYQRKRSDFPEYFLHHLMTWSLIFFSYSLNMLPQGSITMLIHDVTDLGVTIFKLTVDVTNIVIQAIGYFPMLGAWIYFRIWFFPCYIIYKLYEECYGTNICKNVNYSILNMLFTFITGLACLHIFWLYLMIKGMLRRFTSKKAFYDGVSLSSSENKYQTTKENQ